MIKKFVKKTFLIDKPTESVAAAALIISLFGVASRILGLLRDRILAGQFGAGDTLDAYYAAFRIPDLMYNLMIVGALSAAFIPVFTELVSEKKEKEAWRLSSGVLSLQIFITALVSLVLAFFAPEIMQVVTPGYSGEKMELTVMLTRIMFLSPFFLGISGIVGGVLVSFKKFLFYSLAPIFYNIGIIIGALFFVKSMGPIGLAWGVVLGAILHMLVQLPAVRHSGFHFNFEFISAFKNPDVRKVLRLMIPRTLTIAVSQINLTVITIFASTLTAGSLAIFNFASNIQSAPLGLFGISFAIAVFPTLSAYAARKEKAQFILAYSKTLRQILFFVIPSTVLIFVLRAQIVRIVLGTGKFNWEDTIFTFQTLGILALSLFAQSVIPLLTRAFYALQNTKTPLYIALVSEALNITAVFILIKNYGVYGLAIAFSFSSLVNMLLLHIFLKRSLGNLDEKRVFQSVLKIVAASFLAGIVAQLAKMIVGSGGELDTFIAVLVQFVIAGGLGVAIFALSSYYLKSEEYFQFIRSISRKIFKEKKLIEEDIHEVTGA
jgi:putative peptidoglycan lipid II flippase